MLAYYKVNTGKDKLHIRGKQALHIRVFSVEGDTSFPWINIIKLQEELSHPVDKIFTQLRISYSIRIVNVDNNNMIKMI